MLNVRFRSAADAAVAASRMVVAGEPLADVWRFCVVQLLDDYESARRHQGKEDAIAMWAEVPGRVGDERVDASLAALAEHLARRDHWAVPSWATDGTRVSGRWWFVTELQGLHPRALVESPLSFRKRGVFITSDALVRV